MPDSNPDPNGKFRIEVTEEELQTILDAIRYQVEVHEGSIEPEHYRDYQEMLDKLTEVQQER